MPLGFYGQNGQSAVMSPSRVRPHGRQAIALSARSRIRTTPPAPADRTPTRNMARAMTRSAGWSWGSSVRSPAKLTLASVMVRPYLLPGRAVCHALGPGGRWTLRSRDRPASWSRSGAVEQPSWMLTGPGARPLGRRGPMLGAWRNHLLWGMQLTWLGSMVGSDRGAGRGNWGQ